MATILSKAQFARHCAVSAAAVSQWVASGRLGPEALVGTGRRARINVEIAEAQLAGREREAKEPETISKREFARRRNVSPGRVSQWLAAGQIGPEALDGAGRGACIREEIALAHLRERLDPSQRLGLNGAHTRLDSTPALPLAPPPPLSPDDSMDGRLKFEKLRQAELQTRRLEDQDRRARGVYILAADARAARGLIVDKMLAAFETCCSDFASAIAEHLCLPRADVERVLLDVLAPICRRAREDAATRDKTPEAT